MGTRFSQTEEEVIFLSTITDLIDSMVNFSILQVVGTLPDANILFHTATHQRFFNILLVDLLSTCDKQLLGRRISYLQALRNICNHPTFNEGNSVANLRTATHSFVNWLNHEPIVDVWLPSVSADVPLAIARTTFLKICGNISKHSLLRQSGLARDLRSLLKPSNVSLTLDEAVLALQEFFDRFHRDVFNYHASTIAEHLNEIRWGVYEYLLREYRRSYTPDAGDPPGYSFSYPTELHADFAKTLYWDLMNGIRRKPMVERFTVTKNLTMRY